MLEITTFVLCFCVSFTLFVAIENVLPASPKQQPQQQPVIVTPPEPTPEIIIPFSTPHKPPLTAQWLLDETFSRLLDFLTPLLPVVFAFLVLLISLLLFLKLLFWLLRWVFKS